MQLSDHHQRLLNALAAFIYQVLAHSMQDMVDPDDDLENFLEVFALDMNAFARDADLAHTLRFVRRGSQMRSRGE